MDAYLRGEDMTAVSGELARLASLPFLDSLREKRDLDARVVRMAEIAPVFIDMTTDVSRPCEPSAMPMLTPAERRGTFEQIELGFPEEVAVEGARRCLDCYCPSNGECWLQRHSIEYEVFQNRFHGGSAHDYPADFRHDFIMREPNRCINCGRCVRVCRTEVGASCYDNMGRGYDMIVSTADNLPLQMVGCVSCGKCAQTCPTGAIVTNPRRLERYGLDISRCMFCGECVEVCPYNALEQKSFFELADFSRTALAGESLYVRDPGRDDPLRETVTDLVPHVLDAELGRGWVWTPIKDDPVELDEQEGDA
jgi:formate dehydrogenase major subunit